MKINYEDYSFIVSWHSHVDGRLHSRNFDKDETSAGEIFAQSLAQHEDVYDVRICEIRVKQIISKE